MKNKKSIKKINARDWETIASALSGEPNNDPDLVKRFLSDDNFFIYEQWKELSEMDEETKIDVDKAWDRVYSRLQKEGSMTGKIQNTINFSRTRLLRVAATALILIGLGSVIFFIAKNGLAGKEIVVSTKNNQQNDLLTLPDGSRIYLNRNTKLTYRSRFGIHGRNVTLSGEAFFEIARDSTKPFIINAGKAGIRVIGTSFNVLTNNSKEGVEVFVKTGKVLLYDNSGSKNLEIDPGYIGTIEGTASGKILNNDPNYLAWKSGRLVYDGQRLDKVFRDLKKVYDMNIVADDPDILNETWTSPIDNQPEETIIRLICTSFNLMYTHDGKVYHLKRK